MLRSARPSPRRPRRLVLVALAVALVALLGACTHQRQIPDKYGETTQKNFTEGCIETLTQDDPDSEAFTRDQARDVCGCSYDGISGDDGVPYERFKEITEAQEEEPGPLPEEIASIIDRCRSEVRPG